MQPKYDPLSYLAKRRDARMAVTATEPTIGDGTGAHAHQRPRLDARNSESSVSMMDNMRSN